MTPTAIFCRLGICNRRSHGLDTEDLLAWLFQGPFLCFLDNNIHRNNNSGEICEYTQARVGEIKNRSIHAMPSRYGFVPGQGDWGAAEDIGENTSDTVSRRDEYN